MMQGQEQSGGPVSLASPNPENKLFVGGAPPGTDEQTLQQVCHDTRPRRGVTGNACCASKRWAFILKVIHILVSHRMCLCVRGVM